MQKFKNWLIDRLLEKDGLVAVTRDWQTDYVKLAGYKVQHESAMELLAKEYNLLLKDYFELMSTKKLFDYLKSNGIKKIKLNMGKDKLVDVAMAEFQMSFSK